jgi:radical SAM superfamily enzyme YgiQ (UPF0313 family)
VRIVLISTYEMGRQPLGLASPAAWLRNAGHDVSVMDLARERLQAHAITRANVIAVFVPMHTATRLALKILPKLRALNPGAHFCAYGLYAPLNEKFLREKGVQTILGGEYEHGLVELAAGRTVPAISLDRQQFQIPDRTGLPALSTYAQLATAQGSRTAGYTEASRGCKHRCRHCPVVPVYNGAFRVIQQEIVLADIRQQVAAGATHITFGDPDFFNGPTHALRIVEQLHREFPQVTYDATIKIEHLLNHREHLATLHETGCAFVVSAVESIDDKVLFKLEKGHTREGFIEAVHLMRAAHLPLSPTFIPFTPWTTPESNRELLRLLAALDLIENTAPIQLGIRLLIPEGSRLLELDDIRQIIGPFDAKKLTYPWKHPDPALDALSWEIQNLARTAFPRAEIFTRVWKLANCGAFEHPMPARATIPYLTEPWYC